MTMNAIFGLSTAVMKISAVVFVNVQLQLRLHVCMTSS